MLPAEAELLASSRHCNVEVWALGSTVLCIQGAQPCSLAKLALCPSLPACVPTECPAQLQYIAFLGACSADSVGVRLHAHGMHVAERIMVF